MQDKDQGDNPGPSTQAYDLEPPAREGKYIDRHARKPREHLKTWGARLRRRWVEVTSEERELPLTLKDYQLLHHDLLQADEEAFEEIIPQEGEPSEVERQDSKEQAPTPHQSLQLM